MSELALALAFMLCSPAVGQASAPSGNIVLAASDAPADCQATPDVSGPRQPCEARAAKPHAGATAPAGASGANASSPSGKATPGKGKSAKTGKPTHTRTGKLDHSGKAKQGRASYYARHFAGRKMANGEPMNPSDRAAASRTLPLGTTARITNLENGRSTEVEIKDRGPYVAGRSVDVTPRVADELDMKHDGVARVEVAPIEVPQPDGSVKPGEGASAANGSSTPAAPASTERR